MGTKTMKTNLSLNPNIKTKIKLQKAEDKNMKCANKSAKTLLLWLNMKM